MVSRLARNMWMLRVLVYEFARRKLEKNKKRQLVADSSRGSMDEEECLIISMHVEFFRRKPRGLSCPRCVRIQPRDFDILYDALTKERTLA